MTSRKSVVCKDKEYAKCALAFHKKMKGKLEVISKQQLKSEADWSTMYTPGVGAVSSHLAKHPEQAREYTIKSNTVAVISDGSAVLGLGNIGAIAALPVMEGKCAILKEMAGVDGIPLVLGTQDVGELVRTIELLSPGLGAINLEDISAPRCFEVEEALKKKLDIPVMHDDQHGTAMVVLAGILNAAQVVGKDMKKLKVVIVGAGAAGHAIARLLLVAGIKNIVVTDRTGAIYVGRKGVVEYKRKLAKVTNPNREKGSLDEVIQGADVVIGVSGPGTITKEHVKSMADDAIVFALANPVPEIMPSEAKEAGAKVVATGRSDFPNQVNNALAFPGIFKGVLDAGITEIDDAMKVRVAYAIAGLVKKPTVESIIPKVTNPKLVKTVVKAVQGK